MDTTLWAAVIGALITLVGILLGWLITSHEQRKKDRNSAQSLGAALIMESVAAGWHILNTNEIIKRAIGGKLLPTFTFLQIYMPGQPLIYSSAGHRIAVLGPGVARSLVEFHTHLERVVARTQRVCSLNPKVVKKELRLSSLKEVHHDWGYTAWACGEAIRELLDVAKTVLTPEQIEHAEFYAKALSESRNEDFDWSLPTDETVLVGPDDEDDAP